MFFEIPHCVPFFCINKFEFWEKFSFTVLVEAGVKEVTLLGQNVNSYMDKSEESLSIFGSELVENQPSNLAKGFKTIYKPKLGGLR